MYVGMGLDWGNYLKISGYKVCLGISSVVERKIFRIQWVGVNGGMCISITW